MPITPFNPDTALGTDLDTAYFDALVAYINGLPRGEAAYATKVANQAGITTVADISGLSCTWTAEAGRRYKIEAEVLVFSSVADDVCLLSITDSANVAIQQRSVLSRSGAFGVMVAASIDVSGLAGAVTYKCRMARQAGTGSLTVTAGAAFPCIMRVEDIGP